MKNKSGTLNRPQLDCDNLSIRKISLNGVGFGDHFRYDDVPFNVQQAIAEEATIHGRTSGVVYVSGQGYRFGPVV